MNLLELPRDVIAQASTLSPWALLLVKVTLLLAAAWLVHFALSRANPRWRTLLWRGVAVGVAVLTVWSLGLPGVEIHMTPPAPIVAAPVAVTQPKDAERESAVVAADSEELPLDSSVSAEMTTTTPLSAANATADAAQAVESSSVTFSWRGVFVSIWACGVALLVVRLAMAYFRLLGLVKNSQIVPEEITLQTRRIAAALGCRQAVRVRSSREFAVPFLCGLWRPVLVLPERICQPLYRRQLPGILAHELSHVRSHDYGWNAVLEMMSILLWFHPLAWRIGSAHRGACDAVCDAVSAVHVGDVDAYCRTLARVALDGAGHCPAAGLAMARTCDVRRRIAVLQHRVFATALSRRAVVTVTIIGLLVIALFAGARIALAEMKQADQEVTKPVSMSAEEFGRLPAAEQRAILAREFQRRLEMVKNLHFETDTVVKLYTNRDGKPVEPLKQTTNFRFRYWLLGESFRVDRDTSVPTDAELSCSSSEAVNAEEGLGRNVSIWKEGKFPPQGQIVFPFESTDISRYAGWVLDKDGSRSPTGEDYLFRYLLNHKDQFEIEARVEGDKVRLTVPWQPAWAGAPGGSGRRVYLLDPRKGFLPIHCASRYDNSPTEQRRSWREETLAVEESRLVGDVWMPSVLRETSAHSLSPDEIEVLETKASRIESGAVKPSDIQVRFPEGMKVIDAIEGVEYVVDAKGNPAGPVKIARGWKQDPPAGWKKREPTSIPSMASKLSAADREMLGADEQQKQDRRKSLETPLAVLRSGSATATDKRIEAGLEILRTYKIGENEDLWAGAIREFILIGKPAVPQLIEELDRTEREETLRALGFVLRGINDRRAVPAMIRTIPRLLQPPRSDFGLLIQNDPELERFMREHDHESRRASTHLSYGRPIREMMSTLEKMTGQTLGWKEIGFVFLEGGAEQRRIKRTLFLELAQRWVDWWSTHWKDCVENEADAQLGLTRRSLEEYAKTVAAMPRQPQTDFPCGPKVVVDGVIQGLFIRSFEESPSQGFVDLDSGRHATPPADLVKSCADHEPSEKLLAWAEKEGVDWIYVAVTPPGGKPYYAIQPVGMKVWRIGNDRFDNLQKELRESKKLELPSSWEGPLAQVEEKGRQYNEKLTASFLFITREGVCGAVQIRSPMSSPLTPDAFAYTDGGVRYSFIYESGE
jgi:beta-lactamase regulating signal transducer with metallopeptidase domain